MGQRRAGSAALRRVEQGACRAGHSPQRAVAGARL